MQLKGEVCEQDVIESIHNSNMDNSKDSIKSSTATPIEQSQANLSCASLSSCEESEVKIKKHEADNRFCDVKEYPLSSHPNDKSKFNYSVSMIERDQTCDELNKVSTIDAPLVENREEISFLSQPSDHSGECMTALSERDQNQPKTKNAEQPVLLQAHNLNTPAYPFFFSTPEELSNFTKIPSSPLALNAKQKSQCPIHSHTSCIEPLMDDLDRESIYNFVSLFGNLLKKDTNETILENKNRENHEFLSPSSISTASMGSPKSGDTNASAISQNIVTQVLLQSMYCPSDILSKTAMFLVSQLCDIPSENANPLFSGIRSYVHQQHENKYVYRVTLFAEAHRVQKHCIKRWKLFAKSSAPRHIPFKFNIPVWRSRRKKRKIDCCNDVPNNSFVSYFPYSGCNLNDTSQSPYNCHHLCQRKKHLQHMQNFSSEQENTLSGANASNVKSSTVESMHMDVGNIPVSKQIIGTTSQCVASSESNALSFSSNDACVGFTGPPALWYCQVTPRNGCGSEYHCFLVETFGYEQARQLAFECHDSECIIHSLYESSLRLQPQSNKNSINPFEGILSIMQGIVSDQKNQEVKPERFSSFPYTLLFLHKSCREGIEEGLQILRHEQTQQPLCIRVVIKMKEDLTLEKQFFIPSLKLIGNPAESLKAAKDAALQWFGSMLEQRYRHVEIERVVGVVDIERERYVASIHFFAETLIEHLLQSVYSRKHSYVGVRWRRDFFAYEYYIFKYAMGDESSYIFPETHEPSSHPHPVSGQMCHTFNSPLRSHWIAWHKYRRPKCILHEVSQCLSLDFTSIQRVFRTLIHRLSHFIKVNKHAAHMACQASTQANAENISKKSNTKKESPAIYAVELNQALSRISGLSAPIDFVENKKNERFSTSHVILKGKQKSTPSFSKTAAAVPLDKKMNKPISPRRLQPERKASGNTKTDTLSSGYGNEQKLNESHIEAYDEDTDSDDCNTVEKKRPRSRQRGKDIDSSNSSLFCEKGEDGSISRVSKGRLVFDEFSNSYLRIPAATCAKENTQEQEPLTPLWWKWAYNHLSEKKNNFSESSCETGYISEDENSDALSTVSMDESSELVSFLSDVNTNNKFKGNVEDQDFLDQGRPDSARSVPPVVCGSCYHDFVPSTSTNDSNVPYRSYICSYPQVPVCVKNSRAEELLKHLFPNQSRNQIQSIKISNDNIVASPETTIPQNVPFSSHTSNPIVWSSTSGPVDPMANVSACELATHLLPGFLDKGDTVESEEKSRETEDFKFTGDKTSDLLLESDLYSNGWHTPPIHPVVDSFNFVTLGPESVVSAGLKQTNHELLKSDSTTETATKLTTVDSTLKKFLNNSSEISTTDTAVKSFPYKYHPEFDVLESDIIMESIGYESPLISSPKKYVGGILQPLLPCQRSRVINAYYQKLADPSKDDFTKFNEYGRRRTTPSPRSKTHGGDTSTENTGVTQNKVTAQSNRSTPNSRASKEQNSVRYRFPPGPLPTGVYFDVARRLWRCQWRENGKFKTKGFSLGSYSTLEEARSAAILFRCEVGKMPVQPEWLAPYPVDQLYESKKEMGRQRYSGSGTAFLKADGMKELGTSNVKDPFSIDKEISNVNSLSIRSAGDIFTSDSNSSELNETEGLAVKSASDWSSQKAEKACHASTSLSKNVMRTFKGQTLVQPPLKTRSVGRPRKTLPPPLESLSNVTGVSEVSKDYASSTGLNTNPMLNTIKPRGPIAKSVYFDHGRRLWRVQFVVNNQIKTKGFSATKLGMGRARKEAQNFRKLCEKEGLLGELNDSETSDSLYYEAMSRSNSSC